MGVKPKPNVNDRPFNFGNDYNRKVPHSQEKIMPTQGLSYVGVIDQHNADLRGLASVLMN
jgi:hypothetical protein